MTQSAAGLRGGLVVYGTDYNTIDGTCIRDYIHVVDLALAHVKALELLENEDTGFEPINIGTGNGSSVLEVIQTFNKISDFPVSYTLGARRKGDIEKVWAKANKAKELLGWEATRDLEDMLKTSWAWQKSLL